MVWWVRLYFDHTSYFMGVPVRLRWPFGRPVDEQPALLVEMFQEIDRGILKEIELDGQRQRH